MLENFMINKFQKRLSDLPDVPQLSAPELKAYFDASPEELKNALNGVIDTLMRAEGAKNIGFQESDKVHAGNVQDAILNVQGQIKDVALGQIPEGSIGEKQLAGGILEKWTAEASERKAADTALSSQINSTNSTLSSARTSLQNSINTVKKTADNALSTATVKSEIVTGEYKGNGESSIAINLGFKPRAVIVAASKYNSVSFGNTSGPGIGISSNGFYALRYTDNNAYGVRLEFNEPNWIYSYLALK